ncbi:MAG: GNAT family N-acetyltransferase [Acidobacteriia bacterium]|nr:GNAT family N-acetyltransferase [Terriglobia bacterium]
MESGVHVRILRTLAEVEDIRQTWESWPGNRDSDIDFYLTVLRSCPETVRPHIVMIGRGGQPDAMLVGRIDDRQIDFRVGYLHLKSKARILYFVYGALRGNPTAENSELLVREVCKSLSQGEADVAYLNFLRTDSHVYGFGRKIPGILTRDYVPATQLHFSRTIPKSADEFYQSLSSNARWQAKSKQKKLVKAFSGAVNVRCFREVGELDNLIQDVERVAKSSYQRGLGVGFVDSPEMRERLRLKAHKGWLRAYVLYVAQRPCAFWIGDLNGETFGSDYLAYDADLAKYSPGMYLILKVIESFCSGNEDRVTEVDFATGHAQYKEVLGNRRWTESAVYIFAPSLRGFKLNAFKCFTGGIEQVLRRTLDETGLLQMIKKRWRDRLRQKTSGED